MTTLGLIACITCYILLVTLTSFRPHPPAISKYELQRRLKAGEPQAQAWHQKIETIDEVITLVRLFKSILVVIFIYLTVDGYGWLLGGFIAVIGLMALELLARLKFIKKACQKLNNSLEQHLFSFAHLYGKYFKFLRGLKAWKITNPKLSSRQELAYLIEHSQFLSPEEMSHLKAALKLETVKVSMVMKPIADQPTVSQNDLMGPLLLHELHQTGEDIFPVTDKATGSEIVGVIAISHLLSLDDKTSHKVKYYMNSNFPRLKQESSIEQCLKELTETKAFMGIVYDDDDKACGVITINTCLKAIFGRQH